ncbi:MAG: FGGY-family carbohydrate kinase, partial [Demequina sp.]
AELDDMALRADPSKAPTLLAYLDGERSPRRPDASGLMSGIRSDTTREDMALAAFRGVVDGLTRAWIAMQSAGIRHTGSLVVTGGGAKSHTYLQLIADAFGAPVEVRDASDATARGAAIQAAAVLAGERIGVIRDAWKPAQTTMVEPRHSTPQPPSEEYGVLAELEDERVDKMLARSREA